MLDPLDIELPVVLPLDVLDPEVAPRPRRDPRDLVVVVVSVVLAVSGVVVDMAPLPMVELDPLMPG